jgi:inner membrane protein
LFATSAVCDVPYEVPEVFAVAAASMLPDADYPKSWIGHQLGSVSEDLNRLFGHRSFLHSLLALLLITLVLGAPLWRITGNLAPAVAIFVGFGSHLFADMMTLGGLELFWPRRAIAVFPGRDEYRVVTGSGSEAVFLAVVAVQVLLFGPVSRMGFDGLLYRLGGADQVYGRVTKITDGDTISVEVYGQIQPVRLIGVDTPESVDPGQPVGCYGKEASTYTRACYELG